MAVCRLLGIVRRSDPESKSEIEDSNQAHALHILQSLVHDGGLSQVGVVANLALFYLKDFHILADLALEIVIQLSRLTNPG